MMCFLFTASPLNCPPFKLYSRCSNKHSSHYISTMVFTEERMFSFVIIALSKLSLSISLCVDLLGPFLTTLLVVSPFLIYMSIYIS